MTRSRKPRRYASCTATPRTHRYTYLVTAQRADTGERVRTPSVAEFPVRASIAIFRAEQPVYSFSFIPRDNRTSRSSRRASNVVKRINRQPCTTDRLYARSRSAGAGTARTIYVSGQVALDRAGTIVGGRDMRAQAEQVFTNLKAALPPRARRSRTSPSSPFT
jgi:hypothetical protein